jgi:hypothetical protein
VLARAAVMSAEISSFCKSTSIFYSSSTTGFYSSSTTGVSSSTTGYDCS